MKFAVRILPKKDVLDAQGRAVEKVLRQQKFQLERCQVGKYVVLDVPMSDPALAQTEVKKMLDFLLYNPLTEDYEIEPI
jgi:phosphoribosylformylglycinamidine synthase PurS subunit